MLHLALNTVSTLIDNNVEEAYFFLSDVERERLKKITSPPRGHQFLAGRKLIRQMLCNTFGGEPADWHIHADDGMKPYIVGHENIHFSLSHSADTIACAIADHPIGVDVERHNPRRNTAELIAFTCSAAEQVWLGEMSGEAREQQFVALWTIKEAWLKQSGAGLDFASLRTLAWTFCGAEFANGLTWHFEKTNMALSLVSQNLSGLQIDWPLNLTPDVCERRHISCHPD